MTTEAYFWERVDKSGECWEWTGARTTAGYGELCHQGRMVYAHRFAFGEVPAGRLVLHHCDNRACVRPDHLYAGTYKNNADDAVKRGRARGLFPKAGCNVRWKLTEDDCAEIRRLRAAGVTRVVIAARFGISDTHVLNVVRGYSGTKPTKAWIARQEVVA